MQKAQTPRCVVHLRSICWKCLYVFGNFYSWPWTQRFLDCNVCRWSCICCLKGGGVLCFTSCLCEWSLRSSPGKFAGNSFDVACIWCEHSHSQQQVPFVCICACASSVDWALQKTRVKLTWTDDSWRRSDGTPADRTPGRVVLRRRRCLGLLYGRHGTAITRCSATSTSCCCCACALASFLIWLHLVVPASTWHDAQLSPIPIWRLAKGVTSTWRESMHVEIPLSFPDENDAIFAVWSPRCWAYVPTLLQKQDSRKILWPKHAAGSCRQSHSCVNSRFSREFLTHFLTRVSHACAQQHSLLLPVAGQDDEDDDEQEQQDEEEDEHDLPVLQLLLVCNTQQARFVSVKVQRPLPSLTTWHRQVTT